MKAVMVQSSCGSGRGEVQPHLPMTSFSRLVLSGFCFIRGARGSLYDLCCPIISPSVFLSFFFLLGTVFPPQTNPVFKKLLHESHVYMIMGILTLSQLIAYLFTHSLIYSRNKYSLSAFNVSSTVQAQER